MPNQESHYTVLGVSQNATIQEIKKTYRKLALRFHPDKVQDSVDPEAALALFIQIQEAYEVLRDEVKRKNYDRNLGNQNPELPPRPNPNPQAQPAANNQPNQASAYDIIQQIERAVMRRDESKVQELCERYLNLRLSDEQKQSYQSTLNWLLRDCAEFKYNNLALMLVGIGADVNQYGEILKFEHKTGIFSKEFIEIKCYFSDMLAHWDNIALLQRIGADKFKWDIYLVTDRLRSNLANKNINLNDDIKFDISVRLQWLNTLCYKLSEVEDLATLEHIYRKYPYLNRPSFLCDGDPETGTITFDDINLSLAYTRPTAKNTIEKYMGFLGNNSKCVKFNKHRVQYFLDKYMSLPLHIMTNRHIKLEHLAHFSTIFKTNEELTSNLEGLLNFYYNHRAKLVLSIFLGNMLGVWLLTEGIVSLSRDDDKSSSNITKLAFGSAFILPFATILAIQALLILIRLVSLSHIEINGNFDEVFMRLYQNTLLEALINHQEPDPPRYEADRETDIPPNENRPCMTFAYDAQRRNQIEIDVIEEEKEYQHAQRFR